MPHVHASETIVIVGFGWVGQANALALARMGYSVSFYDVVTPPRHYGDTYGALYDQIEGLQTILEKDSENTWYMVCVGDQVEDDGTQNISLIERSLAALSHSRGRIILRSTILHQSLSRLRFDLYLPEFLHELLAVEECFSPYYFVLGRRTQLSLPSFLEQWRTKAARVFEGSPEEAASIKYLSNIWNAIRVGFVNEFGDSLAIPQDQETRRANERILDFVLERGSYLKYGQGFGGHCLPKDLRAWTRAHGGGGRLPLLSGLALSNALHEEFTAQYRTLPQWFSFWDAQSRAETKRFFGRAWQRFNHIESIRTIRRALHPVRSRIESFFLRHSVEEARHRWDKLAKEHPYYYSYPDAPSGRGIDEFEIRESGRKDYARYVTDDPILREHLPTFHGRSILEIGCGVGRMTEYFAQSFMTVYGLDASQEMLAIAKKRLGHLPHVSFLPNEGIDVPLLNNSVDCIFSYLTFRHLPEEGAVLRYLHEVARVLKDGGVMKIQFRTGPQVSRLSWFYGVSVDRDTVRRAIEGYGLRVVKEEKENAKSFWVIAVKPSQRV